ncbi:hypothetical protein B5F08_09485 [Anaeromassilibacillus sp. An172]|uniref:hypothetical protein n=1 Tax=Anaeromassilibacillus sp. An172 TaxID=1965570 RepID=UPI000B36CB71|nr:hypothetical protein [Anaeromassilibacillus sp. An172]OUP77066.1 hypothetical protein B5F08_09485 [Anaeromassilibacillus sp. An172]
MIQCHRQISRSFGACSKRAGRNKKQLEVAKQAAKQEVEKPFSREEELKAKTERLNELNKLLSLEDKPITTQEAQKNQNQNRPKRRL